MLALVIQRSFLQSSEGSNEELPTSTQTQAMLCNNQAMLCNKRYTGELKVLCAVEIIFEL